MEHDMYGITNRLEDLKVEVSKDMPESHSSLIIRGIELSIAEIIKEKGLNFDSETWLKQVELIREGKFPKKTAREFLDEQRKERIRALANKAADRNDETLRKLED